jgi:lipid-binding SYLF domain-containing protein
MTLSRRTVIWALAATGSLSVAGPSSAPAGSSQSVDDKIDIALNRLYASAPLAKDLSTEAKGILVFPRVTKAGFLFGGSYGDGVLRKGGVDIADYSSVSASFGLQVGVQWFGYALFFMNDQAMTHLDNSAGWDIGVGPSIVIVDRAMAVKHSTSTLTQDIYAFIFGQNGLMAGAGIEGSKITRIR